MSAHRRPELDWTWLNSRTVSVCIRHCLIQTDTLLVSAGGIWSQSLHARFGYSST